MELDNGMVIGAMPYNQSDAPAKAIKCPWCKQNVPDDENVYHYKSIGQECWICADCLKDEVGNMSPDELAIMIGADIEKARFV